MGIELTPDQLNCSYLAEHWWKHSTSQLFEISGKAGTGKTFMVLYLIKNIFDLELDDVLFCAYTGKAASVLTRSGCPAQTIHSAIYDYVKRPQYDEDGKMIRKPSGAPVLKGVFEKKSQLKKNYSLIVVDEASFVNIDVAKDLLSFKIPVVALGDLNQLPPVFGDQFFLTNPDVVLRQIMRQADGSPVVYLANQILEGNPLKVGVYKTSYVIRRDDVTDFQLQTADMILCGTNSLRHAINNKFRDEYLRYKYRDFPQLGEKVICKRNNWDRSIGGGIYLTNGMTGTVEYVDKSSYKKNSFIMDFKPDFGKKSFRNLNVNYDRLMKGENYEEVDFGDKFLDQFEFGYANTVHSSQGSQWKSVVFFDQKFMGYDDQRRLEYTAITRAEEQIGILL